MFVFCHILFLDIFIMSLLDFVWGRFFQNVTDLTDLVSSGRNKNEEENSFIHEYELKGLAFRAERFVTLYPSLAYSLTTSFLYTILSFHNNFYIFTFLHVGLSVFLAICTNYVYIKQQTKR
jgi:hypothetical protein